MRAEDLKLAEFILTKDDDRSKRKGNDKDMIRDGNEGDNKYNSEEDDYEESEEELAMIMKKGNGSLLSELKQVAK